MRSSRSTLAKAAAILVVGCGSKDASSSPSSSTTSPEPESGPMVAAERTNAAPAASGETIEWARISLPPR